MAFSDYTCRWRRWRNLRGQLQKMRRWFWGKLLNRQTWVSIVSMGIFIFRVVRWIKGFLELFE